MFTLSDPRLWLAFGLAVVVTAAGFRVVRGDVARKELHPGVVPGALLFGAGWAITGVCPGAAFAQFGEGQLVAGISVFGIFAGAWLRRRHADLGRVAMEAPMSATHPMKWVVGIDSTPSSWGAMKMARWLFDRSHGRQRFRGIHAVHPSFVPRPYRGAQWLTQRAEMLARASASAVHAAPAFGAFEALASDAPEDLLRQVSVDASADGILVGRSGAIAGWSLVSLGRVTRRILRHAPVPVMVVPPDYEPSTTGHGPIMIAVTARDDAVEAVRFGRRLAHALDLRPLLVHVEVDRTPAPIAAVDSGIAYSMAIAEQARRHEEEPSRLEEWLEHHRFTDLPLRRVQARGPGPRLLDTAHEEDATMILCGSRQLSLADRILQSSVGSDLAGRADRPVVVVPTPYAAG